MSLMSCANPPGYAKGPTKYCGRMTVWKVASGGTGPLPVPGLSSKATVWSVFDERSWPVCVDCAAFTVFAA